MHRPTLDDVFLTLTGRSLRDAESEESAAEPTTTTPPTTTAPARRCPHDDLDHQPHDRRRPRRPDPGGGGSFWRESYVVFRRQLRMNLRNPAWVLIGIMQPVLYLFLFGPLLEPIVGQFPDSPDNAFTFLVPGCSSSSACSGRSSPASG